MDVSDETVPENKDNLHEFYNIVSKPDYTDKEVRDFFKKINLTITDPDMRYKPTRAELNKISEIHDEFEDRFDCEYKDY